MFFFQAIARASSLFPIVFLALFALDGPVHSYPSSEFDQCVLTAKANPAVSSVPEKSIKAFCDCALKANIDEGKDIQPSAEKCLSKHINN